MRINKSQQQEEKFRIGGKQRSREERGEIGHLIEKEGKQRVKKIEGKKSKKTI